MKMRRGLPPRKRRVMGREERKEPPTTPPPAPYHIGEVNEMMRRCLLGYRRGSTPRTPVVVYGGVCLVAGRASVCVPVPFAPVLVAFRRQRLYGLAPPPISPWCSGFSLQPSPSAAAGQRSPSHGQPAFLLHFVYSFFSCICCLF